MGRLGPNDWYILRWQVLERDNFTCQGCGQSAPNVVLDVDHKTPVSEGGINDFENLRTLCAACHKGRTLDWRTRKGRAPVIDAVDQIEKFLVADIVFQNDAGFVGFDPIGLIGDKKSLIDACDYLYRTGRLSKGIAKNEWPYSLVWKPGTIPKWLAERQPKELESLFGYIQKYPNLSETKTLSVE